MSPNIVAPCRYEELFEWQQPTHLTHVSQIPNHTFHHCVFCPLPCIQPTVVCAQCKKIGFLQPTYGQTQMVVCWMTCGPRLPKPKPTCNSYLFCLHSCLGNMRKDMRNTAHVCTTILLNLVISSGIRRHVDAFWFPRARPSATCGPVDSRPSARGRNSAKR